MPKMSFCTKLWFLFLTGFAVFVGVKINSLFQVPPLPNLPNTWWGPGLPPAKEDTSVNPFKINVKDEVLTDLKNRLSQIRPFTPPLEGIQQQYGMNTNLLKEIVEFWKTKYNWREREQYLNKYPQYKTKIQGLNIHFIRVKPTATSNLQVVPLLLIHGWPGSVREFYEVIPYLTTPQKGRNFVFEVIIPSLPGYGFSEAAVRPGLGAAQVAVVFKNLMKRLGFDKYYLQGGDWGAAISANMATLFPNNVLGIHSNLCFINTPLAKLKTLLGGFYPGLLIDKKLEHKMYPVGKIFSRLMLETGYFHIQATKPDTIGVGLNDSPVGLAAYIIEKFTTWTDPTWINKADGGLKLKYTYSDLLDNVMIYWITGSITTSTRLYSETMNKTQNALGLQENPVLVPAACAKFANEILYQPDCILKDKYVNLVQSNDLPQGGHFAAFEEPKLFSDDVWAAVEKFRDIHNRVK